MIEALAEEAQADPVFLQHLLYWGLQALIASLPLGGLSVILHRAGRKGVWPSFPWVLALICGPVYGMGLWLAKGEGFYQYGYIVGWISGWASGAYISICISLVLFAIIGLAPRPQP